MSTDPEAGESAQKGDRALTPGGERPAGQVHAVGPGEAVRRNPDGTYTVVPAATPSDPEASEREEGADRKS
jgi:hypothetical protein